MPTSLAMPVGTPALSSNSFNNLQVSQANQSPQLSEAVDWIAIAIQSLEDSLATLALILAVT